MLVFHQGKQIVNGNVWSEVLQPGIQAWPSILKKRVVNVSADIKSWTASPQEAAFGLLVHFFLPSSKLSLPLQRASAVKVRQDCRAERDVEEEQRSSLKRDSFTASPPHLHQTVQLLSAPPRLLSLSISKQTRSPSHTWPAFKSSYLSPRAHTHIITQTHEDLERAMPVNTLTHALHPSVFVSSLNSCTEPAGWQLYLCCNGRP